MKTVSKSLILLAVLASLLSFVKFNHCRDAGWGVPDVYVHACYSDISALYSDRGIDKHVFPYSSATNAVEYPVITGLVMWGTSYLVSDEENPYRNYFDINIALLVLLFIGLVITIFKINPEFAYLLPAAPAVIASLFINWDLWAVITAALALYFFIKEKPDLSALFLGISIATKFFPIVFLFPILLISIKTGRLKYFLRYFAITLITWLAINLPIALTNYQGWSRFYKMNFTRAADWGSIWYGITALGGKVSALNYLSILITFILIAALAIFYIDISETRTHHQNLALMIFLTMAAFTSVNKVYSPQYILWLTPFAVLAITSKKERSAFWVWQGAELIYHFAIWQYFAGFLGGKFGLPENWYALTIFIRIAALLYFCLTLARTALAARSTSQRLSRGSLLEFLSKATDGYA